MASLFGDLAENHSVVNALQRWLALLYGAGAKATLVHARQCLNF
jgi:hypothetical protein